MPDSAAQPDDTEMRAYVERVLSTHYELDREIGRGGMGVVYRARDRRLKRVVAIKVLPPELGFRSEIKTRFLREAETAAQLSHPNIVPIFSVDETEGLVYFVMAYVDGENLARRVHEQGMLGPDETRRIMRDVADALAYAHDRRVIHRDIKPDNILIEAESGRPMVTDFGIARAVSEGDSRLTATGMAIGTPAYMSPEQAAGERDIDGRSDLYSLGVLAYQMLVGEPPFVAASTPAMLVKHISERPTPIEQRRPDIPTDLARAIMLCLEKDPAMRFPSASALVTALDTGVSPAPTAPRLESQPAAAPAPVSAPASLPVYDYTPSLEERQRWDAPKVVAFRKKVAPYLFVNAVIVVASIFGDSDFFGITVLWSIYLAFKYAKLWADGYDWRDVFRQPRDRELLEVADELVDQMRGILDRDKRRQLRLERRQRQQVRRSGALVAPGAPPPDVRPESVLQAAGAHASVVRQAAADRNEVLALVDGMGSADRARLPDVARSADALYDRVQALAITLADLDRGLAPSAVESVDAEIARLESAANPLDERGSDERVRRLTILRRQRRAMHDLAERRRSVAGKLETCALALQNLKLDTLRLRAGAQTHQHITALAVNALSLADSVAEAVQNSDGAGASGLAGSTRAAPARYSAGRG